MIERYKPTGTPLTPYEDELLVNLVEECSEVIQAATKLLRFGKESYKGYGDNQERLGLEIGDVQTVLNKCLEIGLISPEVLLTGQARKEERLQRYMQNDPPPRERRMRNAEA